MRVVHELGPVCDRIAIIAARDSGATAEETAALFWDLHALSLRGIVIGIASLAWYGLEFDPGYPQAQRLLQHPRREGPLTRRQLLRGRFQDLTAEGLAEVAERLAAEGLVRLDGKSFEALSLADFVRDLFARPEFPEPKPFWPGVVSQQQS